MKRTTLILVIKGDEPAAQLRAITGGLQAAGYEIEHASARPTDAGGPIDLQIGTLSDVADVKLPAAKPELNLSPEQAAILEVATEAAEAAKVLLKEFRSFNRYERKDDKVKATRGKKEGAAGSAAAPAAEEGVGGQPEAPEGDEPAADEPQASGNVEPNQEGDEA